MRSLHPNRLRFAAFSDKNPFMAPVKALAETVRAHRQPVPADNPLLAMEQACVLDDDKLAGELGPNCATR